MPECTISVVLPVYKCAACLNELYERLHTVLDTIDRDHEIVFVNDGSPDEAWEIIRELARRDKRVKAINLSRNFGQHFALTAGLDKTIGRYVVVMDCDLQDSPEAISQLFEKLLGGYDVVFARRLRRQDKILKKISSQIFYRVFSFLTDATVDPQAGNFSIAHKHVIQSFRQLREHNRAYSLFIRWMGYKIGTVDIKHGERKKGQSSYTFNKLISLAVSNILSNSNKPLKISIYGGLLMSLLAFVAAFYLMLRYILFGIPLMGWTSTIVSLYLIGGLILANLGIVGLYVGKVFEETKNRPLYIVKETINF